MGGCKECGDEFFPDKVDVPYFSKKTKAKYESAENAFDAFDISEKDGKITLEELVTGAKSLKPPLEETQVKELFQKLNKNGDSALDKGEFFDALGEILKPPQEVEETTPAPEETTPAPTEVPTPQVSGSCRCPTDVDADEDALIVDQTNGACKINPQTGMMTVKVIGSKSGSPGCRLRPQP